MSLQADAPSARAIRPSKITSCASTLCPGWLCRIRRRHQAAGESLLMLKWATVPLLEHTTACRHRQCTRGAYFKKGARSPEGGQCFIARLAGPRFESDVGRRARKDIDRRNFRLRDSHTGASRTASSSSGIGVFNATALLQDFSEPVTHPLDHGVIVSDPSLNFVKPIRMRV